LADPCGTSWRVFNQARARTRMALGWMARDTPIDPGQLAHAVAAMRIVAADTRHAALPNRMMRRQREAGRRVLVARRARRGGRIHSPVPDGCELGAHHGLVRAVTLAALHPVAAVGPGLPLRELRGAGMAGQAVVWFGPVDVVGRRGCNVLGRPAMTGRAVLVEARQPLGLGTAVALLAHLGRDGGRRGLVNPRRVRPRR
jgi:hypothetical protein